MTVAVDDSDAFESREFPMTDKDFRRIQSLAYELTGITLSDHKRNMVYGRLSRRLRRLQVLSFSDYCDLLVDDGGSEVGEFINSITTNLTSFFREVHHFEFLADQLIPRIIQTNAGSRRVRVWSAGCSTGEEPYSIAMVLRSNLRLRDWDVKVLATDLDSNVVERAKSGIYPIDRAASVPELYKKFLHADANRENVKVKDDVAGLITFKVLNLLHGWPMKGPFDIIFCRNVVIYFDADTQRVLFDRYADIMKSNGNLFIGHSESLHNISTRFKPIGRTMYECCS